MQCGTRLSRPLVVFVCLVAALGTLRFALVPARATASTPAAGAAPEGGDDRRLIEMTATSHPLPQVRGIFIRTVAIDPSLDQNPAASIKKGRRELSRVFYDGVVASGGRFRLRCADDGYPEPKLVDGKLVNEPAEHIIYTSNGRDMMLYHTGSSAAFTGSATENQRGILADAQKVTGLITTWLSKPNPFRDDLKLELISGSYAEPGRVVKYRQVAPELGIAINTDCIPAHGYLAEKSTVVDAKSGAIIAETDNLNPFEVAPGVWRPRTIVHSYFATSVHNGAMSAVLRDGQPIIQLEERLEVPFAVPDQSDADQFTPSAPSGSQFGYKVAADGATVQLAKPGFGVGGGDKLLKELDRLDPPKPTAREIVPPSATAPAVLGAARHPAIPVAVVVVSLVAAAFAVRFIFKARHSGR